MKTDSVRLVLPDVNVLLALAWPNHQFYAAATDFMEKHKGQWATCALTEIGFLRLSTNAAVVGAQKSPEDAAQLLIAMTSDAQHRFLGSMPSPVSTKWKGIWGRIRGTKQVTDLYLLSLAEANDARFVTFDTRLTALGASKPVTVLTAKS